uniref:Uncharacterized protein n=1 Tax=Oryza glumipatula TaxID=40148 RepID=A0A0E0AQB5_9ORYZ
MALPPLHLMRLKLLGSNSAALFLSRQLHLYSFVIYLFLYKVKHKPDGPFMPYVVPAPAVRDKGVSCRDEGPSLACTHAIKGATIDCTLQDVHEYAGDEHMEE